MKNESLEVAPKSEKRKNKHSKKNEQKRSLEDDGGRAQKKAKKKKKLFVAKGSQKDEIDETLDEELDETLEEDLDENGKKKPSKRQLKREKAEKQAEEARKATELQVIEKALNYVSKWKHARSEWKFEKVKQIWLSTHLLDEAFVPDEHFPIVLEYFEGCKGQARKRLVDKAMEVIRKAEDKIEEDEDVVESIEYKRARQLLQALPTET